ncbi:MAG: polysaccharide biosynthesis protein [Parasporobacterium sp.]|nr:polysaccharide biosynthesis protein [Parasporobacterium sp.]
MLVCFDIIAIAASYFLALWFRFDLRFDSIPKDYLQEYLYTILPYIAVCIVLFWAFRLYSAIWRFASYRELRNLILATIIDIAFYVAGTCIFLWPMPISYYVFGIVLQFILTLGVRFSYRFVLLIRGRNNSQVDASRVMIIGAGAAGQVIQRDMKMSEKMKERPVVFIDDNPNKWNRTIDGVPVAGGRESILEAVQKYNVEKIYLAMPGATAEQRRDILNICKETNCELKTLPGIYQLVNGEASVSQMQDVSVDDLLGREPIKPDLKEVFGFIRGKVVLVTGGGGSIGSELCRQIAGHEPKQLIIFDVYENNAYDIQNELLETHPDLNLITLIGSVRDSRRMFDVFAQYKPQIVYHAAAHKHVPLMEDSPDEAIKNNAIGTYKTAYAAMVNQCERFVLISTDKAVNPVNIMGRTLYYRANHSERRAVGFSRLALGFG